MSRDKLDQKFVLRGEIDWSVIALKFQLSMASVNEFETEDRPHSPFD